MASGSRPIVLMRSVIIANQAHVILYTEGLCLWPYLLIAIWPKVPWFHRLFVCLLAYRVEPGNRIHHTFWSHQHG